MAGQEGVACWLGQEEPTTWALSTPLGPRQLTGHVLFSPVSGPIPHLWMGPQHTRGHNPLSALLTAARPRPHSRDMSVGGTSPKPQTARLPTALLPSPHESARDRPCGGPQAGPIWKVLWVTGDARPPLPLQASMSGPLQPGRSLTTKRAH